jgi:hypothetical protein
VDNVKGGDWGRCAGICTTNTPGGSSAVGASSAILVSSESVPDRFRKTIADYRCRQILVLFFWFLRKT